MNKRVAFNFCIVVIVMVLLIYALARVPATAPTATSASSDKRAVFDCADGSSIAATFHLPADTSVDIVLSDGRELSLPHAISGSGARYATSGEAIVFWNKGNSAFIQENGTTTYDDCTTIDD